MTRKILSLALAFLWTVATAFAQTIPTPPQTDQIILDNNSNSKADPGDKIRYKVTIQNTGAAPATGTTLNAVPDAKTTFTAGSFRSSPVAANDGPYACTGNVGISVPAASGVKINDFDDNLAGATLTVITPPTNGSAALNNDGSFTYTPNAGYTGSDQFTYQINDATPVAGAAAADIQATVSITVSNMIWFVDNTGGGTGGTGTLSNPFKTLTNFNGSAGPQAGQVVFIKSTGTGYHGGIVLKNNMSLFGSGHSGGTNLANPGVLPFLVADNSLALPAIGGTRPILWNINFASLGVSPYYGITLASGNTIRGVEVGRCDGVKIFGNAFGTLTIGNTTNPDVALSGNKFALDLSNGAFAATSKFASINSPDSSRILLNTVSGTLASASTTVAALGSGGGITIDIQNSSAALDFGNTTVNNFNGNTCISITNSATGSVTFSNLSMPYVGNGTGLLASNGGTINIGGTGSAITARHPLDITNTSLGSGATFASITSNNFFNKAVNLDNVSGPLVINGGSIATNPITPANIAFDVNAGSNTITYAGSISYTGASTNRVVEITGRTGGTVTLSGTINATTGTGINVASNTGGTITFSGASKSLTTGGNTAVTLSSNTGATVNFSGGGLALSTSSGTGFTATGGGTVTVQGTGNTISSTTGTALNVANTTIGASGLTFQSISSNGGSNGIVLNGSSGNLTVTGDGTGHANGSGGSLSNITGGVLGNAPVYCLTASGTITLKSMNMSLNTNCYSGMLVDNNAGGTITANLTGCTFIGVTSSVVQNKSLLHFEGGGSSNVTANVQNCFFSSNRTYGLYATAAGTSTMNVTLNQSGFGTDINTGAPVNNPGSTITNPPPFSVGVTNSSSAQVDYVISNNTFWGADGLLGALYAVTISGATTVAGSYLNGTISNNKIGKAGVTGSGAANNSAGIGLLPGTGGTFQATVINNDIRQVNSFGINFKNTVSGATSTSSVKIKGNTLAEPDVTGSPLFQRAIVVDPGNSGGASMIACAEIGGTVPGEPNIISGGWQAGNFIRVTNNNNAVALRLPGLSPTSGATAAQVNAFVGTNNPTAAGAVNTSLGTAGIVGGAVCF